LAIRFRSLDLSNKEHLFDTSNTNGVTSLERNLQDLVGGGGRNEGNGKDDSMMFFVGLMAVSVSVVSESLLRNLEAR